MFKHGRFTREAKQVSRVFRRMAKDGEAMVATVMSRHDLRPPKAIRRKAHVRRALRAAKATKGEQK
jgi:hypothetical protein